MARTRLELISLDLSGAQRRWLSLLLVAFSALFALLVGVCLATLSILMVYWDTHRIPVLIGMASLYGVIGLALALFGLRKAGNMPPIFANTLAELSKDQEQLDSS